MTAGKNQVPIFKAALDVPWNDWPEDLDESKAQMLSSVLAKVDSDFSTNINDVTSSVLSNHHNVIVAVKLSDGFPFFLRHIPSTVFVSNAFLFVLGAKAFSDLLIQLDIKQSTRCLSVHVDESRLFEFPKYCISQEYPAIKTVKKLISKNKNKDRNK